MNLKQILLLFLALLLPACVFIFLKGFGENEFSVPALFKDELPMVLPECNVQPTLPYHIPDSTLSDLDLKADSLALVFFGGGSEQGLARVKEEYSNLPLKMFMLDKDKHAKEMKCIYFLQEPFNVVLVDRSGSLRGQYNSNDRDEVDRLLMELAIIFRKY